MRKLFISAILLSMTFILSGCTNGVALSNEATIQNNETTVESSNNEIIIESEDGTLLNEETTKNSNKITLEEAKEIALKHANLTSDKVSFIKIKTEWDDGLEKYSIEFYYENKEYDYEINAVTGQILEYDYDVENYNIRNNQNSNGNINNNQNSNETVKISMEQAKEVALNHSNLINAEVVFGKCELDFDDGIKKYDIKFYNNNKEYEYEIDANTGSIISYERG